MSDDVLNTRVTQVITLAFCCIIILILIDLAWDVYLGLPGFHVWGELSILAIAATATLLLLRLLLRERSAMSRLLADLEAARTESRHWRQQSRELVTGLGDAIQARFTDWQLSQAEAEIALLLLKGLSLKDIARLRSTSERTVREQARSLYRKAGLNGRAALSAYFLEDLLSPAQ